MNENLLRVYSQAAAPADRAASTRALLRQQDGAQKSVAHGVEVVHTINVRPDELTQLLSSDEKNALSAMFCDGASRAYGGTPVSVRVSGNAVDRIV